MVAPQKTRQDSKDNQENWQNVKSKKTLRAEKIWKKNYSTISNDNQASSSNTMEYSSDSSSYSDAVKRNIKEIILSKINFWGTSKSDGNEDNQLTNSSSFKSFSIAFSNNKDVPIKEEKAESDIKKENKKLRRKAKNINKYIKKLQEQVHLQAQNEINEGIDKECAFSANIIDNNNDSKKSNSTYVPTNEEPTDEQNITIQNTPKNVISEGDVSVWSSIKQRNDI